MKFFKARNKQTVANNYESREVFLKRSFNLSYIITNQSKKGHATAAFTLNVYGHVTYQMQEASAGRMQVYINDILNL